MVDRSNNKNKSYQANDVAQPYHKRDVQQDDNENIKSGILSGSFW